MIFIILKRAILLDTTVSDNNSSNKKGSTQFMHYLYSVVEFNGNPFLAKITVEEYDVDGKHRAYNMQRIKMSALSRAQYSQMKSAYRGKFASNADAISIADLFKLVKNYDSKFKPNSVNKMFLNDEGTPRIFYHGSKTQFTEFDRSKSSKKVRLNVLGEGNYFTANKSAAERYGDNVIEESDGDCLSFSLSDLIKNTIK